MITIKTLNTVQRELNENKEFVQSSEYCVIEPGLTSFNKDQIITHADLMKHLENNDINTISVLPHLSTTIDLDKEYDIMNNKVKKILDDAESKMIDLIDDFNEKVENDENDNTFQEIETSDLVMKIDDLKDYVEDYSN